ncbi:MAG: flagellar biosynthesis protein FliQ [Myxococcales bacterium]|nr:flagellar biosynthesis protein FliQ [Myxococcales bacterium]
MTIEEISALLQATVKVSLLLSAPVLATALFSGLFISIFQAATQINEQTLTFVPKIVLTLAVFALLFPWIMGQLVEFGVQVISQAGVRGP